MNKKTEDVFKRIIQDRLKLYCIENPEFKKHYKKENKSIDECVKYIYGAVQSSGRNGFEDDEIYNMAIHYFVEDDVKVGSSAPSHMILNTSKAAEVKFTEAEKEEIKKEARERLIKKQMDKITGKDKKKLSKKNDDNVQTLF